MFTVFNDHSFYFITKKSCCIIYGEKHSKYLNFVNDKQKRIFEQIQIVKIKIYFGTLYKNKGEMFYIVCNYSGLLGVNLLYLSDI